MISAGNSIPLIFLGAISGTFLLLLIYHVWFKRTYFQAEARLRDEDDEYDIGNEQVLTLVGRKEFRKMSKRPKLWDVQIPRLGAWKVQKGLDPGKNFRHNDLDEDMVKDAGKWNTIKPVSVAYIKNAPQRLPASPLPNQSHCSSVPSVPTTSSPMSRRPDPSTVQGSGDEEPRRSEAYDKAAIEAVQVSVLISMPTRPFQRGGGETAGPLELGIAKISLDGKRKWKRRPSAQAV